MSNKVQIDKNLVEAKTIENVNGGMVNAKDLVKVTENGMIDKGKGKEVGKPATQIPRPPSLSLHRVMKKAKDGKLSKFLSNLK